jgi:hypothetical protein
VPTIACRSSSLRPASGSAMSGRISATLPSSPVGSFSPMMCSCARMCGVGCALVDSVQSGDEDMAQTGSQHPLWRAFIPVRPDSQATARSAVGELQQAISEPRNCPACLGDHHRGKHECVRRFPALVPSLHSGIRSRLAPCGWPDAQSLESKTRNSPVPSLDRGRLARYGVTFVRLATIGRHRGLGKGKLSDHAAVRHLGAPR